MSWSSPVLCYNRVIWLVAYERRDKLTLTRFKLLFSVLGGIECAGREVVLASDIKRLSTGSCECRNLNG